MPNIVLQKPNQKSWIRYIHQRIEKNKNFLGFISGPTGSGKSYCSLRIAEELDPEFCIERCVFDGIQLMELINSKKLKTGSVLVFEEMGVAMSHKNWQSVMNKMINYLLQTFRHRRFILLMNSPYLDFVDSSTRKLFHAELQTVSINFNTNQCLVKPQLIQYNGRLQKFYYKYLRVITPEGVVPVTKWKVDLPSKELRQEYEIKKRLFTDKLNTTILNELKNTKKKKDTMKCKQCGYQWSPRSLVPQQCPACRRNPYLSSANKDIKRSFNSKNSKEIN